VATKPSLEAGSQAGVRLSDLSDRAVAILTSLLVGQALLGVCDSEPPSGYGARNGQVPPLAAGRQRTNETDRTADGKAKYEQDEAAHG
jgi:hypothetical protein